MHVHILDGHAIFNPLAAGHTSLWGWRFEPADDSIVHVVVLQDFLVIHEDMFLEDKDDCMENVYMFNSMPGMCSFLEYTLFKECKHAYLVKRVNMMELSVI